MAAETARMFASLEEQAQKIMGVYIKAGYEAVSPAIIQPADVFLDVIGETLRARTYVFTDPDGDELCLRPDITVPTCRLHVERHADPDKRANYCYNGPAFRFQPQGSSSAHPREFRQAGIEGFAEPDREKAEAQTLATILQALRASGLGECRVRIGDLGLFRAVLAAVNMPERWRARLRHHFWRPEAFRNEMTRLMTASADGLRHIPTELLDDLEPRDPQRAEAEVARYCDEMGIDVIGVRSLAEVTENLQSKVADAHAAPLSEEAAAIISSYLDICAPAGAAGSRMKDLMRDNGIDISGAIDVYHRRLQLLDRAGVDIEHAEFSAEFGRTLEYYTGFVFEVVAPGDADSSPVAGGGRYDSLMKAAGAKSDVPAVGGAIHTERLLAAVTGAKS